MRPGWKYLLHLYPSFFGPLKIFQKMIKLLSFLAAVTSGSKHIYRTTLRVLYSQNLPKQKRDTNEISSSTLCFDPKENLNISNASQDYQCAHCLSIVANDAVIECCCAKETYCSQTCQSCHWKTHKKIHREWMKEKFHNLRWKKKPI